MYAKNRDIKQKGLAMIFGMAVSITTATASHADDTEIFTAYTSTSPNSNVVFVLDTSGSMSDQPQGGTDSRSKMQIVKDVFEELIFDPNNPSDHTTINPNNNGLNFALMRFDEGNNGNSNGGYFITPLQTLNEDTKLQIWGAVNGLQANGWTPLAETAYEAKLYFSGERAHFGRTSSPGTNHTEIVDDNDNYISPFSNLTVGEDCSINNHLVILTDGLPTKDSNADSQINSLSDTDASCAFSDTQNTDCLPNVAKYLHDTDFLPNIDDIQNVKTHTIAFDLNDADAVALLQQTAQVGGGVHLSASGATLSEAITEVIASVVKSAKSFVTPATSISSANRFVHDNTLYFALFEPKVSPQWIGNLKGYMVDENGLLIDRNGNPALDDNGNFVSDISSKWSNGDGAEIGAGGAAAKILARTTPRRIYTQNSATPTASTLVNFEAANVTPADLQVDAQEVASLVNWVRSRDANAMLDPLHSTPQVVNYGGTIGTVIFFGTNEGLLHAIDAESGEEKFAFLPKALLGNLKTFRDDISGEDHPYGLDGPISVLVRDIDEDQNIEAGDGDRVIIIVGMRRGGNNYYALDVTNPNNPPTLLWQAIGGSTDFPNLAQSWSRAIITKVKTGNPSSPELKDIVIFAGGNDAQYDDGSTPDADTITGNTIYAVDLISGEPVWCSSSSTEACSVNAANQAFSGQPSLAISDMVHAIPSNLTAMDLDSDGTMDLLYAIDVMGNIFRIDFDTISGTDSDARYQPSGRLFANLAGNNRRFYNAINAAISQSGSQYKIHLNVGSGRRPNPLNRITSDRFYSMRDPHVQTALPSVSDFPVITESSLTNTTSSTTISADSKGWYFDLMGTGEKVLSKASTRGGYVFFTTYVPPEPPAADQQTCTPPLGMAYLYAIALDNSAALDEQRRIVLQSTGIPPDVTFLTLEQPDPTPDPENPYVSTDSKTVLLVGTELVSFGEVGQAKLTDALNKTAEKIYWHLN